MWTKIKEALLMAMAHLCYMQLKKKLDNEHQAQMDEIIDYIQEKIDEGAQIYLLASEEFLENTFALYCEPSTKSSLVKHLSMVDIDED